MPRGILYVETRPGSPEEAAAYHEWYNEVHLKEVVAVEGFVAARRYEPVGHDGPFVAIYEIEAEDLEEARARLRKALDSTASKPVGVQVDPPPKMLYYSEIASCSQ